jgi:hypothetical protein
MLGAIAPPLQFGMERGIFTASSAVMRMGIATFFATDEELHGLFLDEREDPCC